MPAVNRLQDTSNIYADIDGGKNDNTYEAIQETTLKPINPSSAGVGGSNGNDYISVRCSTKPCPPPLRLRDRISNNGNRYTIWPDSQLTDDYLHVDPETADGLPREVEDKEHNDLCDSTECNDYISIVSGINDGESQENVVSCCDDGTRQISGALSHKYRRDSAACKSDAQC